MIAGVFLAGQLDGAREGAFQRDLALARVELAKARLEAPSSPDC